MLLLQPICIAFPAHQGALHQIFGITALTYLSFSLKKPKIFQNSSRHEKNDYAEIYTEK